MKRSTFLPITLVLLAPALAFAQDGGGTQPEGGAAETEAPTKDELAAQFLKEAKAKLGKQPDADAQESIKKLVEIWKDAEVSEAAKKPVPDLLVRYAKDDKKVLVAVAAIEALGELGPEEGTKPILDILDKALGAKQPSVDMYGTCLRAVKKLADPKKGTVDTLIKLLKHSEADVAAKAADAMTGYRAASGKIRKEMLEELIKNTEGVYSQAQAQTTGTPARRWNIIQHNTMEALKALSGQSFKNPAEARQWFNDHKKDKMWDA